MVALVDQMGRSIVVPARPRRIISLVPSITELLVDLGLELSIIGRTKFCVHPNHIVSSIPKIGGTKTIKVEKVRRLAPDLIIASKEENIEEQVWACTANSTPPVITYVSNVKTVSDAYDMILDIGKITHTNSIAERLVHQLIGAEPTITSTLSPAIYLIWRKPYMSVGGDTFISDMMLRAGYSNMLAGQLRYPEVSPQDLQALQPEHILLSSEPFPFRKKHIQELSDLCPNADIQLVDGEHYSWYGSRMLTAFGAWRQPK